MSALVSEAELQDLAARALASYGLRASDAEDAARILVLGDLFGLHTHGVSRIESYGERLLLGGIKARPDIRVERVAPTMAKIDGDNGVGTLVGMRALQAASELARESGVGIAFARGSNHFGPVSPYLWLAAEAGFASIIGSNATTTIAPTGGSDARLGNSPVGFAVPSPGGQHIMLDMAISVVARARIRAALNRGSAIPDTWATDSQGNKTTDPKAALDGFLLPIGGYKGYGLALIVDLFAGLLSGAAYLTHVKSWVDAPEAPQNLGHFFILIDTKKLGSSEWLLARMNDFAAILHDSRRPIQPRRCGCRVKLNWAKWRGSGARASRLMRRCWRGWRRGRRPKGHSCVPAIFLSNGYMGATVRVAIHTSVLVSAARSRNGASFEFISFLPDPSDKKR